MLTNRIPAAPPVLPHYFSWYFAAIDTDEVIVVHEGGLPSCRTERHAFSEPRAATVWASEHECDVCAHPRLTENGDCPDCGWDTGAQEEPGIDDGPQRVETSPAYHAAMRDAGKGAMLR